MRHTRSFPWVPSSIVKRVVSSWVCDLCGKPASDTELLVYMSEAFEVDLCLTHVSEFHQQMQSLSSSGRSLGRVPRKSLPQPQRRASLQTSD
jgi:hypothetical protein